MKNYDNKNIIIGIGNCGREDDGLGWAFLDEIKSKLPSHFDIEYRYQLQIEDAELISHYDTVHFVDAHKVSLENGFNSNKCIPIETHHFSSHELPPETILYLADHIYNRKPKSYIIGISGESFNLNIGLTESAQENLKNAISFFEKNTLHISSLQAQ